MNTLEVLEIEEGLTHEVSDEALESVGAMASQGRCSAGWPNTEWSCSYGAS